MPDFCTVPSCPKYNKQYCRLHKNIQSGKAAKTDETLDRRERSQKVETKNNRSTRDKVSKGITSASKKRKQIQTKSKKRERIDRKEYGPRAKAFVAAHPECQLKTPVCTGRAVCVHHPVMKTSIEILLDESEWMSSCAACNNWVEEHDKEAREKGLKKSKFSPKRQLK